MWRATTIPRRRCPPRPTSPHPRDGVFRQPRAGGRPQPAIRAVLRAGDRSPSRRARRSGACGAVGTGASDQRRHTRAWRRRSVRTTPRSSCGCPRPDDAPGACGSSASCTSAVIWRGPAWELVLLSARAVRPHDRRPRCRRAARLSGRVKLAALKAGRLHDHVAYSALEFLPITEILARGADASAHDRDARTRAGAETWISSGWRSSNTILCIVNGVKAHSMAGRCCWWRPDGAHAADSREVHRGRSRSVLSDRSSSS